MSIIETEKLTRLYGTLAAVDGLTLSVEAGEIFGLLGPNGAGKSTTIKMLTTLLPPTSGQARVAGFDLASPRNRAGLRGAIGYVPQLIFLDEPTVGLDPVARKTVWERIGELRASYGTTILLTTHYMEEADHLCDRVAIMHLGKVVAVGTPAELKATISGSATLDDVFAHYTGETLASGGDYSDTRRTRRAARRLG